MARTNRYRDRDLLAAPRGFTETFLKYNHSIEHAYYKCANTIK